MISRLSGIILEKDSASILIDVQGIGYEVHVSLNSLFDAPDIGESVTLHTHFVVRDDAQQLFGFTRLQERNLFRLLIKINGVGPKMAIAVLSGVSYDEFVRCVNQNDIAGLVKLPGVGKKIAERLLMEMRDKIPTLASSSESASSAIEPTMSEISREAESALIALGYKPQEATKMVNRTSENERDSVEILIRAALRKTVS
jgi:Holliday junction DNA helicase RuvA